MGLMPLIYLFETFNVFFYDENLRNFLAILLFCYKIALLKMCDFLECNFLSFIRYIGFIFITFLIRKTSIQNFFSSELFLLPDLFVPKLFAIKKFKAFTRTFQFKIFFFISPRAFFDPIKLFLLQCFFTSLRFADYLQLVSGELFVLNKFPKSFF